MDFSHGPRDGRGGNTGTRLDWLCGHCGAHNFARRAVCFQCTHPKDHTATILKDNNLHSEIKGGRGGEEPNPVLVVLGLAMDTTTSRIRDLFQQHADVVDVRIMRDKGSAGGSSRGFAFVQFATTEDAAVALNRTKGAKIDGRSVRISFSRDQGKAAKAAWQDPKLWERPANLSEAFKFDSRTGQYYDRKSGFYYDPASCLYYHGESGIYYRWDAINNCYLQVDERGVAIPASSNDAAGASSSSAGAAAAAAAASSAKKNDAASSSTTAAEGKAKKKKTAADGGGKKKRKKKGPIAFSFSKKVKAAKQQQQPAGKQGASAASSANNPPPSLASVQEMAAKAAAAAAAAKNVLASLKQAGGGVGTSAAAAASTGGKAAAVPSPAGGGALPWAGLTSGGLLGGGGGRAQQQQQPSVSSAGAVASASSSSVPLGQVPNDIALQRQHLQLEKKICRLCKRKFPTLEKLYQHVRMSAMHKKNLELLEIKRVADRERQARSKPPPRRVLRKGEGRRKDEKPVTPSAFEKMVSKAAASVKKPIADSNKGSKMLKAMGWKKGQGLGKTKQGITAPVQADMYSQGAGLGSQPTGENAIRPGDSYHDAATKKARARFERASRHGGGGSSSYYKKKKPQNAANAYLAAMNEYKNSSCTEKDEYARAMLK